MFPECSTGDTQVKSASDKEEAVAAAKAVEWAALQSRKDEEMAEYNSEMATLNQEAEVLRKQVGLHQAVKPLLSP